MNLPTRCPSCGKELHVKTLECHHCSTQINGDYAMPILCQLSDEEQAFVTRFIQASGSLKEMASAMNLSYPTVRNYLNEIIKKIDSYATK